MTSLSDTEYRDLRVTRDGPAARLVLNRPEKRNALSLELMDEVIEALRDVSAQRATRAIVIEGAGPAFSAGHDLSEMIDREKAFLGHLFDRCTVMMETIHELPQPVIAKVHGIATAAGCQLVAACDLAVAAEGTRFATPGVKIGLFCSTPMVPVSRAVGRKRALQMLLTGEPIDAATALDWGLVNRVVAHEELEPAVIELVDGDRSVERPHGRHRKARLLLPDRSCRGRSLRAMPGRHDRERTGARCPGGHDRVPRKARPELATRVARRRISPAAGPAGAQLPRGCSIPRPA